MLSPRRQLDEGNEMVFRDSIAKSGDKRPSGKDRLESTGESTDENYTVYNDKNHRPSMPNKCTFRKRRGESVRRLQCVSSWMRDCYSNHLRFGGYIMNVVGAWCGTRPMAPDRPRDRSRNPSRHSEAFWHTP